MISEFHFKKRNTSKLISNCCSSSSDWIENTLGALFDNRHKWWEPMTPTNKQMDEKNNKKHFRHLALVTLCCVFPLQFINILFQLRVFLSNRFQYTACHRCSLITHRIYFLLNCWLVLLVIRCIYRFCFCLCAIVYDVFILIKSLWVILKLSATECVKMCKHLFEEEKKETSTAFKRQNINAHMIAIPSTKKMCKKLDRIYNVFCFFFFIFIYKMQCMNEIVIILFHLRLFSFVLFVYR